MSCMSAIRTICRFPVWAGIFLISSCSCRNSGKPTVGPKTTEVAPITELDFPAVPDSLVSPESRADYAIYHFWDAMDFTDTALSLDTAFMEQNFVNYIQLYDYASADGRAKGAGRLMVRAEVSEPAYRFVADIAERYLTDPNSPMRNEEFFIPFIHEIVAHGVFSPEEKARLEYLETRILKNRPGTVGTDFAFVDRAGKRRRLSSEVKGTEYTLLLFYDYDCETCAGVEKDMMEDPALASATASGLLHIVAVNVFGDDLAEWKRQSASFPEGWTVGYSPGCEVVEHDIYGINAAPTLYLFDSERRVILKDVPLQTASSVLDRIRALRANPIHKTHSETPH